MTFEYVMSVYQIWCEWDINEGNRVYTTEEQAKIAAENNATIEEILEEDDASLDDLIQEGLIGFQKLDVVVVKMHKEE